MVTGSQPVESHLHRHLTEHLNSEIVLNTIQTEADAMKWLQTTFLHIRAIRNPTHYGFRRELTTDQINRELEGKNRSRLLILQFININIKLSSEIFLSINHKLN